MKTAVSIPDDVFNAAERVAKRMGMSRSRFYTTAVQKLVEEQHAGRVKKALDAVYETQDSSLDHVLAEMQRISIAGEQEDW